jgi:tripartite-type tricarboxylate transporter receptor subunit TctC
MTTRRHFMKLAAATLATPALIGTSRAQTWPNRNIRVIVPYAAGSSIDVIGRIVMDPLATVLGVPVIIENRGGAGGTVGCTIASKADPDGYNMLVHSSAHTVAPAIYANLQYDASRDFSGVAIFGTLPTVLIVSPKRGFKTIDDFVAAARKANNFTYGSAGIGSTTHWAAERLRASAKFDGVHVPYRGGLDAVTEIFAGRVDFATMGLASALSFIQSGELQALAVCTKERSKALPNVPTTLEAGYPNSEYTYWNALMVPSKTPRDIVAKLHEATKKALATAAVQTKFAPQGIEPMYMTPAEFDEQIKQDIRENQALVKAIGLKPV